MVNEQTRAKFTHYDYFVTEFFLCFFQAAHCVLYTEMPATTQAKKEKISRGKSVEYYEASTLSVKDESSNK